MIGPDTSRKETDGVDRRAAWPPPFGEVPGNFALGVAPPWLREPIASMRFAEKKLIEHTFSPVSTQVVFISRFLKSCGYGKKRIEMAKARVGFIGRLRPIKTQGAPSALLLELEVVARWVEVGRTCYLTSLTLSRPGGRLFRCALHTKVDYTAGRSCSLLIQWKLCVRTRKETYSPQAALKAIKIYRQPGASLHIGY